MVPTLLDQANACWAKVKVLGLRGETEIQALVDTGLCLPISLAVPLGLELVDVGDIELADGTVVQGDLIFLGRVEWHGVERQVHISLTRSQMSLLGSGLLNDSELYLNYLTRAARIVKA